MMARFKRSFAAEMRKLRATKMWLIMAIVIFAYTLMMAGTFAALFGGMQDQGQGLPGAAKMIYSSAASFGYAVPLLFGAMLATTELRHKILSLAFIAEPRRKIVLAAKLSALTIFGLLLGAVGVAASVGLGATIYGLLGGNTELGDLAVWWLILRTVVALAIWAWIGFGVGLLVRNQAITIVIALIFTQFLEPTLRMGAMLWEWSANVAKFLPGAATDFFIGASILNNIGSIDPDAPTNTAGLEIWQGGLVLLLTAVIAVLLGYMTTWRKDVQ